MDVTRWMSSLRTGRRAQLALAATGILLVTVLVVSLLIGSARGRHRPPTAAQSTPATALRPPSTTALPSSPPPTEVPTPEEPTPPAGVAPLATDSGARIRLPELGISLPIVHGDGVNAPLYQAVQAPELSPIGSGQRAMIYAHAQAGMFGNLLRSGRVGNHVDVHLASGQELHYVIREYYPRWPIRDTRWLEPLNRNQLILTTCTSYNLSDPRVVAVAEPV